ncbi:MFS general substrate transporter [Sistotremastrum niveocremeum HHB9708]|uniref:MFS general substrate transporter n=1 Tax=Sistotremastrum niveocremeum HHB9708 TaxID=1314777 RepID=A0A165A5G1_9AGAM|nr:MFS general substrate transporter [Sistotremastrum niveocremeum HHB9708]
MLDQNEKQSDVLREDLQVPSRSASILSVDEHAERRLVRKIDTRILPILCLLYLFAYLDRTNLGNARLQGLPQDTLHGDPTGKKFDWVNSAFFFSYILVQVPATILAKLFRPRIWIGCMAIGWGISSTLMATAFDFSGLMVARIALGTFEAGFGPGIPVYMLSVQALYYTKEELGLRMAYWFGFAAVAGAFGGLIAFGIQNAHLAISNWRLLFIVEGIPAILLGLVCIWFLPDRPDEPSWHFTEDERNLSIARMNRYSTKEGTRSVNKHHIKEAFKDWKIYVGGVIYFGLNNALASISAFLPTILKTFGFTNADAQLLTVAPYACATVVIVILSWLSDRLQTRGLVVASSCTIAAIGYILLLTVVSNVHVRYFAVFCITSGTYTSIGLVIAWFAHNLASETKRATGVPMFMAIGQCGSILGSHIYPSTQGPKYIKGFAGKSIQFLGMQRAYRLSSILRPSIHSRTVSYRLENRRRDKIFGKPISGEQINTSENADKAPAFRYLP